MIYGEHIRLPAIKRDDLPRFVEQQSDPEAIRTLSCNLPLSGSDEEWFQDGRTQDPAARPLAIDLGEADERLPDGSCGLHKIDNHSRHAGSGILIGDKDQWDQGLGTDVVRTALYHRFEALRLHGIYLRVSECDARGMTFNRSAGFKDEAWLRHDTFREGR